jgi:Ca2+-binding EF-hand superfamily protein
VTISGNYANSVAFSFSPAAMRSPEPMPPVQEPEPPPPQPDPSPESPADLPRTTLPGLLEAPPISESDRAAKLFAKLDRDGDGSVTKAEFKEGAMELLKRAGSRRARREDGEDDERSVKRAQRFERRLDRLFNRVDANHDGSVDAAELAEALRHVRRLGGAKPASDAPSEGDPTTTTAKVSVSVVMAVQQYTRASQGETPQGALEAAA